MLTQNVMQHPNSPASLYNVILKQRAGFTEWKEGPHKYQNCLCTMWKVMYLQETLQKTFLYSFKSIPQSGPLPPSQRWVFPVPGEGVRQSGSHKYGDQMEFGAPGKLWSVMTAWDYYITARHEIDPHYTNKIQRRLHLKCLLIT